MRSSRLHAGKDVFSPTARYELRIPYGDPRELVMDILKYGAEVEVAPPATLRREVAAQHTDDAAQYAEPQALAQAEEAKR